MPCRPLYCVCGCFTIPQRYILCLMTFFAVAVSYTMRVVMNIAIVAMVVPKKNKTNYTSECPQVDKIYEVKGGTYNWTGEQEGMILGAFFPGYALTHLPGGFMADVIGAKHVLSISIAMSSVFTLLTPQAIDIGDWPMLVVLRVIVGLSQGSLYPCMSTLLAKWVPTRERTGLGAFVNSGNQLGSIAGYLGTSYVLANINWQWAFYIWGISGMIWYVFFVICCHSEPAKHPFITEEEAEMLHNDIGPSKKLKVPWKAILLDPINWGLLAGQVGHDLIFFLVVVELPTYLDRVLKFNIKQNGILNSVPYLCLWLCSSISGVIADFIIAKEWASVLFMRQLYTFVGNVGPAVFVLAASFMGCNRIAAAALFIASMLVMGPFYAGMKVNVLDNTKNFAGIIMALVNGIGALAFWPVPSIAKKMTYNNKLAEWRLVFFILFIVDTLLTVMYVFLASSERAKWDLEVEEEEE